MSLKPIESCTLKEILVLFDIEEITSEELKKAKKKVLMLHPDKNIGNDTCKYFEYFKNAYYKLEEINKFLNTNTKQSTEYNNNVTTEQQKAFYNYYKKNGLDENQEKFSKLFNEVFDNVSTKEQDGYGEWLKTNEGIYDKSDLEKSRQKAMQLTIKTDVIQTFNELEQYSDLKDAHINSVITLDVDDVFHKKEKYYSIEEFQRSRTKDTNNLNLMSKQMEHETIIQNQRKNEKMSSMDMAYGFMKETEKSNSKFNEYCSKFLFIKN